MFTYNPSQEGKEIKNWLDQRMNCEDIAMNFLIANATGELLFLKFVICIKIPKCKEHRPVSIDAQWVKGKIINLGSDTFGNPIFPKVLQN